MTRPEGMLQIFAPMGSIALYVISERFVPERLDCLVGIQAVNLGPRREMSDWEDQSQISGCPKPIVFGQGEMCFWSTWNLALVERHGQGFLGRLQIYQQDDIDPVD